ncbi:MAG TPA: protein kinase [Micromonosporaceae bacterium]|nr:protein kinase [Micromonosporaceae bacterium]
MTHAGAHGACALPTSGRAEDEYVAGQGATAGIPLRATDPRQLGEYRLLRRLGEGGMGSVYLAESGDGTPVALKVIREDLAEEPEFRRRFRGEVARAQEVPPFCTAEVLDADPDHDPPYLVVEYVDGPSLADVVADRGPLTPANLHGLAIGVATALTAIHGAGVIHRDLKPSNVLLAPGTPKVIDFGIAQPAEDADSDTRTDQLMGTVAYMAPERLEPAMGRALTPAADIFAWGAVVAYAATGRVPFAGDSGPSTAVAILTQRPNLEGIAEPLRHLVKRALAKRPEARPTARQLLDELLSTAPRTVLPNGRGARLAPPAAGPAQAVTPAIVAGAEAAAAELAVVPEPVAAMGTVDAPIGAAPGPAATGPGAPDAAPSGGIESDDAALTTGLALAYVDVTAGNGTTAVIDEPTPVTALIRSAEPPTEVRPGPYVAPYVAPYAAQPPLQGQSSIGPQIGPPRDPAPTATWRSANDPHTGLDALLDDAAITTAPMANAPVTAAPTRMANHGDGGPRRSPWRGFGVGVLVVCVLASAGAVAGLLTGAIKLPANHPAASISSPPVSTGSPSVPVSTAPSQSPSASPSPSVSTPVNLPVFAYNTIDDPLTTELDWRQSQSSKFLASCKFSTSGYTVTLTNLSKTQSYRCSGPTTTFGDLRVAVTITLGTAASCASIWLRFQNGPAYGYALQICADHVTFAIHSGLAFAGISTIAMKPAIAAGSKVRFAIVASGSTFTILQCAVSSSGCENSQPLGQVMNTAFDQPGVVTLGIVEPKSAAVSKSYHVTFQDIQVSSNTPPPPPPSPSTATSPPAVEPSQSPDPGPPTP